MSEKPQNRFDRMMDKISALSSDRRNFMKTFLGLFGVIFLKTYDDVTFGGEYQIRALRPFFKPLKVDEASLSVDLEKALFKVAIKHQEKWITVSEISLPKNSKSHFEKLATKSPQLLSPENPRVILTKGSMEIPKGSDGLVIFHGKEASFTFNLKSKCVNRIHRIFNPPKTRFFVPMGSSSISKENSILSRE